jgi:hypothetical protein
MISLVKDGGNLAEVLVDVARAVASGNLRVFLCNLPNGVLKEILTRKNVSSAGLFEKHDLVDAVYKSCAVERAFYEVKSSTTKVGEPAKQAVRECGKCKMSKTQDGFSKNQVDCCLLRVFFPLIHLFKVVI